MNGWNELKTDRRWAASGSIGSVKAQEERSASSCTSEKRDDTKPCHLSVDEFTDIPVVLFPESKSNRKCDSTSVSLSLQQYMLDVTTDYW